MVEISRLFYGLSTNIQILAISQGHRLGAEDLCASHGCRSRMGLGFGIGSLAMPCRNWGHKIQDTSGLIGVSSGLIGVSRGLIGVSSGLIGVSSR